MNVDVVLGTEEILSPQDFIGAGEKVDFWAEDVREEWLEKLEENILEDYFRQDSSLQNDKAFALF